MYAGKIVFAQVMDHLPMHCFRRCVALYGGQYKVRRFSCRDQFPCMAFAQLTYRESLRDIEACLRAQKSKLYHMGIRDHVARATLADANERRDWRIHADFAQALIHLARRLYADDDLGLDLDASLYTILPVLSVTAFERTPLDQMLSDGEPTSHHHLPTNQLNLFS